MKNEEYSPDLVTIVDEAGEEFVFEELDRIETESGRYMALVAMPENEDDDSDELVILKIVEENGELTLHPIEDDAEFEEVGQIFQERLSELFEFEE